MDDQADEQVDNRADNWADDWADDRADDVNEKKMCRFKRKTDANDKKM